MGRANFQLILLKCLSHLCGIKTLADCTGHFSYKTMLHPSIPFQGTIVSSYRPMVYLFPVSICRAPQAWAAHYTREHLLRPHGQPRPQAQICKAKQRYHYILLQYYPAEQQGNELWGGACPRFDDAQPHLGSCIFGCTHRRLDSPMRKAPANSKMPAMITA